MALVERFHVLWAGPQGWGSGWQTTAQFQQVIVRVGGEAMQNAASAISRGGGDAAVWPFVTKRESRKQLHKVLPPHCLQQEKTRHRREINANGATWQETHLLQHALVLNADEVATLCIEPRLRCLANQRQLDAVDGRGVSCPETCSLFCMKGTTSNTKKNRSLFGQLRDGRSHLAKFAQ